MVQLALKWWVSINSREVTRLTSSPLGTVECAMSDDLQKERPLVTNPLRVIAALAPSPADRLSLGWAKRLTGSYSYSQPETGGLRELLRAWAVIADVCHEADTALDRMRSDAGDNLARLAAEADIPSLSKACHSEILASAPDGDGRQQASRLGNALKKATPFATALDQTYPLLAFDDVVALRSQLDEVRDSLAQLPDSDFAFKGEVVDLTDFLDQLLVQSCSNYAWLLGPRTAKEAHDRFIAFSLQAGMTDEGRFAKAALATAVTLAGLLGPVPGLLSAATSCALTAADALGLDIVVRRQLENRLAARRAPVGTSEDRP